MLGVSCNSQYWYRSQSLSFYLCSFVAAYTAFTANSCLVESFLLTAPLLSPVRSKTNYGYPSDMTLPLQQARASQSMSMSMSMSMRLYASSSTVNNDNDNNDDKNDPDDSNAASQNTNPKPANSNHDYSTEEILMCLHLQVVPESGIALTEALRQVQEYSQSFPFAAVLPVQPLSYLPTPSGGVEIKFLRKKTDGKSGVDGGLCFFIQETTAAGNTDADADAESETGAEELDSSAAVAVNVNVNVNEDSLDNNNDDDKSRSRMISVTVKRNSAGQNIRKIIAERLVITSYVASLTAVGNSYGVGNSDSEIGAAPAAPRSQGAVITGSRPSPVAEQVVRVTSIFHKWM